MQIQVTKQACLSLVVIEQTSIDTIVSWKKYLIDYITNSCSFD